jgi:hypothetical protein
MYGTRSVLIYLLELEWEVLHKSKELANTGLNPLQMVMTRQESKPKDVMHLKQWKEFTKKDKEIEQNNRRRVQKRLKEIIIRENLQKNVEMEEGWNKT